MNDLFEMYVVPQDPEDPDPEGWEVPTPVKKIEEEDC